MQSRYPTSLVVDPSDVGTPIERWLRRCLDADPHHVRKLLRQRRVRWGGPEVRHPDGAERVLRAGETLPEAGRVWVLAAPRERRPPAPNRRIRVRFLFGDEHLAVVDKPAGLAMEPGPRHGSATLLNALVHRFPELLGLGRRRNWGLVHRLDLGTSGIVVVARTELAWERLVAQFRRRQVEKRYVALVRLPPEGLPVGLVEEDVGGKQALTEILEVEAAGPGAPVARVTLRPVTGRMHQLRVHLAGRGAPVLGDARHGSGRDDLTARLYLKRLALHAGFLGFRHPSSGKRLAFERPWPADLRHSWRRAQKLFGGGATPTVGPPDDGTAGGPGRSGAGGG